MTNPFIFPNLQETILLDPMFEIPGSNIVEVKITESVVSGKDQPEFVRKSTTTFNSADSSEQSVEMDDGTVRRVHN